MTRAPLNATIVAHALSVIHSSSVGRVFIGLVPVSVADTPKARASGAG